MIPIDGREWLKAKHENGWYWIKLLVWPAGVWQPANWNGKAFWINGEAFDVACIDCVWADRIKEPQT